MRTPLNTLAVVLMRVLRARPWVTVDGWPDTEENSLRIADAVARRAKPGTRVYVLCDTPTEAARAFAIATTFSPLHAVSPVFVTKNSVRGFMVFVLSRVVFYTHSTFGNPRSGGRRIHVLLGHGHGPKSAIPVGVERHYFSDLAVTNTTTWGTDAIRAKGITKPNAVLAVGNPREDAFHEPLLHGKLSGLGISPHRPLVVWLPTYRNAAIGAGEMTGNMKNASWTEGTPLWDTPGFDDAVRHTHQRCEQLGITLVVKMHPAEDASAFHAWGVPVITSPMLTDAGLSLYQFLALSDALITDYSSVWVDFLATGKPIGLLFRDEESFGATRGFGSPALRDVAAELFLPNNRSVDVFLEGVSSGRPWGVSARKRIAERIGRVGSGNRSDAVLDAVAVHAGIARVDMPYKSTRA
ncbi:MAG: hypothetical protein JWQ43_861 [Glaciihabitans sp.]|nr:hypothetical protein [Glaciihabitans sp.]